MSTRENKASARDALVLKGKIRYRPGIFLSASNPRRNSFCKVHEICEMPLSTREPRPPTPTDEKRVNERTIKWLVRLAYRDNLFAIICTAEETIWRPRPSPMLAVHLRCRDSETRFYALRSDSTRRVERERESECLQRLEAKIPSPARGASFFPVYLRAEWDPPGGNFSQKLGYFLRLSWDATGDGILPWYPYVFLHTSARIFINPFAAGIQII